MLFFLLTTFSYAQNHWKKIEVNDPKNKTAHYKRKKISKNEQLYALDLERFKIELKGASKKKKAIISLPNTTGGISRFMIKETVVFEGGLAKKYADVKSYMAKSMDDPTLTAKISMGSDGIHIMLLSVGNGLFYIDPNTKDNTTYVAYKREDLVEGLNNFECKVVQGNSESLYVNKSVVTNGKEGKLRVFRLALACSGEYAQFHLERQGIAESAAEKIKKEVVLSAMNTSVTRINAVFERDVSVRMLLVAHNDSVVFLDSETDGITEGTPAKMLKEIQDICDTYIGNENYDIGHLFSTQGDGVAVLESVCVNGLKAMGVTGRLDPIGDAYTIDYVAHEMGHQFGATHTQNSSCNRTNATAVEPGSASTIMGYAGICDSDSEDTIEIDIQKNSDAYFHAVSILQMNSTLEKSATCAMILETNNKVPQVNAGFDVSIPKATPFILKGVAIDADSKKMLTYNWEQIDNEIAVMPPVSTNIGGPLFRSLPSTTSPERFFPTLESVVNGSFNTWEVLPSVARELNFALTVRDNFFEGGAVASDELKITVTEAEPFTVANPNTIDWTVGASQSITWEVSTTNEFPINCQYVKVKLSIDGGVTFPITLTESTPNNGSFNFTIPNYPSTKARILVAAVDNVFYNVNNTNFTIKANESGFMVTAITDRKSVCVTVEDSVTYELSVHFMDDFNETISFNATNVPNGAAVSFVPTTTNKDGTVLMTINNLAKVAAQNKEITVVSTSASFTQNSFVSLAFLDTFLSEVTTTKPEDNSINTNLAPILFWDIISEATAYEVQVALDSAFNSLVLETNSFTNSYVFSTILKENTTYYWRVKAINNCGESAYSSIKNFTTSHPSYCTSTFTKEATGAEHITNVTFNTINNDSGNDIVDGYQDFTTLNTIVQKGATYPISVAYDTAGFQDHCFVFVDWNQDFEFDVATERFDLGSGNKSDTTTTFDIKVPDDALVGNTRMRVVIEYDDPTNTYGESACDATHKTEWGETEDYRIIVEPTSLLNTEDIVVPNQFSLYPNPTDGKVSLTFETQSGNPISVKLFDMAGRQIEVKNFINTTSIFSKELLFANVPPGLYVLRVQHGEYQINKKLIFK